MKNLMRNTLTIKKRVVGAEDSNHNATYTHTTLIEDKPARIYKKAVTEFRNDGSLVIKKVQKIAFPYEGALDLDEGDLAIINSITFEIMKAILIYASSIAHHWELEVKVIEGE